MSPVKPNPGFVLLSGQPAGRASIALVLAARSQAEAEAAGAPTVADRLLAMCPVSLMDAACELDVPYRQMRGHALGLMRAGKARLWRGRLVRVLGPDELERREQLNPHPVG